MTDEETFELDLSHLVSDAGDLHSPRQILLAGQAGSGKTHSALTTTEVEGLYPVLYLDLEDSTVGVVSNFDHSRVDVIRIRSHKQLSQVIKAITTKTHKYKTVVIDTLDKAQERALEYYQNQNPSDGFAAWRELGEWLGNDDGLVNSLKAADFLSVLVIHTREEKSDSGAIVQRLKLQGSQKDNLPSIPDAVFYQTRRVVKVEGEPEPKAVTTVYTLGTKTFEQAKNRFNLPLKMVDTTLKDVLEYIRNDSKND